MSFKVCLDAGHGLGCVNGSPDGTYMEDEFTFSLCELIANELAVYGIKSIKVRTYEEYPELDYRYKMANENGVDLFLSIHSDGFGDTDANGMTVFTADGCSAVSEALADSLVASLGTAYDLTRGHKKKALKVLTHSKMPGVLVEYGFHTNREDLAKLKSWDERNVMAKLTAKAVADILGCTAMDEPSAWAKSSWLLAETSGIMDGTRPQDAVTREEMAVVLDRLGVL